MYSTTFTAANLGYTPVVVSDCVASVRGEDSHEMTLELMALSFAWVMPGDEVVKLLTSGQSTPLPLIAVTSAVNAPPTMATYA